MIVLAKSIPVSEASNCLNTVFLALQASNITHKHTIKILMFNAFTKWSTM